MGEVNRNLVDVSFVKNEFVGFAEVLDTDNFTMGGIRGGRHYATRTKRGSYARYELKSSIVITFLVDVR